MKRIIVGILFSVFLAGSANADTLLFEDFEDENVSYTTSVSQFSDGYYDYFIRSNGSDYSSSVSFNNVQGTSWFAAQDIDAEGASLPATMTFSGIDISGYTSLGFSALFAEDDASDGKEDWDKKDYVKIECSIDGGDFINLLAFENDGSTYNTQAYLDTDFDGTGDGTALTDTFSEFAALIEGTGSTLDIRISFYLDSGDEDIAIDNLSITGVKAVPTPSAVLLMGSGLVVLIGCIRKKKRIGL